MTPETLSEQNLISLLQGYSMPNINVFWPVVHEKKIFEYLSKFPYFAPYWAPKGASPLNKSESSSSKHVSCQRWLKLA